MENDEVKKKLLNKIHIFLIFFLLIRITAIYAQDSSTNNFKQRIEWSADKNAFEYKVEIRSGGKTVNTFTTSDNFVNLHLPAGSYDYRVTVYDFLGREQDVSAWQKFEISKANAPAFNNFEENVEVDISTSGKVTLPVEVDNVADGASVALVNVKTGEAIKGSLLLSTAAGAVATGKSEIAKASAEFPKISDGEWKLVVTNPSGLKSESPAIAVKTVDKEKERKAAELAAAKAEKEAREAAERAEKEAAELAAKAEKEAREAAELAAKEEKKAAERAAKEQKEKEKLAAKQLKSNNMYIMAEDDEEDDFDEIEATPEIEIAEAPEPEEEEEKEEQPEKPKRAPHKIWGLEVKAGASAAINLFDSDLLGLKNYDSVTQGAMPDNITPAPLAVISFVPNLSWRIKPGLEVSASGFVYESRSAAFGDDEWEYNQKFSYNNVQAALIGQLSLLPQKIFLNVKAGGGVTEILVDTEYVRDRQPTKKAFIYPKLNAGLSFEFVPFKYLVIELGADYNRILSNKINFSYLMPYLEVGVRF